MNLDFLIKYAEAKKEKKYIKVIYYNIVLFTITLKSFYNDLFKHINKQIEDYITSSRHS